MTKQLDETLPDKIHFESLEALKNDPEVKAHAALMRQAASKMRPPCVQDEDRQRALNDLELFSNGEIDSFHILDRHEKTIRAALDASLANVEKNEVRSQQPAIVDGCVSIPMTMPSIKGETEQKLVSALYYSNPTNGDTIWVAHSIAHSYSVKELKSITKETP